MAWRRPGAASRGGHGAAATGDGVARGARRGGGGGGRGRRRGAAVAAAGVGHGAATRPSRGAGGGVARGPWRGRGRGRRPAAATAQPRQQRAAASGGGQGTVGGGGGGRGGRPWRRRTSLGRPADLWARGHGAGALSAELPRRRGAGPWRRRLDSRGPGGGRWIRTGPAATCGARAGVRLGGVELGGLSSAVPSLGGRAGDGWNTRSAGGGPYATSAVA